MRVVLTHSAILGLLYCWTASIADASPSVSPRSTTRAEGSAFVSAWSGIRTGSACGGREGGCSNSLSRSVNRSPAAARAPRHGTPGAGWPTSRARPRPTRMVRMAADYYEILGVDRNCSKSELKTAFRKLARQYHPDVNDAPDAQNKFNEISQAYTVSRLCRALSRKHRDRFVTLSLLRHCL